MNLKLDKIYKNLSDEELVAKIVVTNDTALFGLLYDRFSKVIYNKCLSFSKNEAEAEDLTQDIFLKLFVKIKTFEGKSKFFSWFYAFTYNHCVNYVNRDAAKKIQKTSVQLKDSYELLIEVDDSSLFKLKVDKLQKALELIDPEDKMILMLKYQDEISIKELSKALIISESAVKMRLKRAKARIVKVYNENF